MANMDENKFLEVFVEVTVGSTKMSPLDSAIYDTVYEKINPKYFSYWHKYLMKIADDFGDDFNGYDEWYENLKFEDINEEDLRRFLLPESKIKINISSQANIMLNIVSLMREFYDRTAKVVGNRKNIAFGYMISRNSSYMCMYICAIDGYDSKIYSQAKKIHTECEDRWRDMMNKFNETSTTITMVSQGRSKNTAIYKSKKSTPDMIEEANDNAEMFNENNIANFRIAEVSKDNFRLKRERDKSTKIDIDRVVLDLFDSIDVTEEFKSNINDNRVTCIF